MTTKKKVIKKKPVVKKTTTVKSSVSTKWNWDKHQIPNPGDYFVTKGVEWRVVRINHPTGWINEISINWAIFHITNGELRTQINKTKWYFQKKQSITKWWYVVWSKLTVKQKIFCSHYIKNDELRWNATLSYNEAFGFKLSEKNRTRDLDKDLKEIWWTSEYDKAYNNCASQASVLLRSLKIQEENRKLLNEMLSHYIVDSKLSKIILNWDNWDSLGGIKEYNRIKWRIVDKTEHSGELTIASALILKRKKQKDESKKK